MYADLYIQWNHEVHADHGNSEGIQHRSSQACARYESTPMTVSTTWISMNQPAEKPLALHLVATHTVYMCVCGVLSWNCLLFFIE